MFNLNESPLLSRVLAKALQRSSSWTRIHNWLRPTEVNRINLQWLTGRRCPFPSASGASARGTVPVFAERKIRCHPAGPDRAVASSSPAEWLWDFDGTAMPETRLTRLNYFRWPSFSYLLLEIINLHQIPRISIDYDSLLVTELSQLILDKPIQRLLWNHFSSRNGLLDSVVIRPNTWIRLGNGSQ